MEEHRRGEAQRCHAVEQADRAFHESQTAAHALRLQRLAARKGAIQASNAPISAAANAPAAQAR